MGLQTAPISGMLGGCGQSPRLFPLPRRAKGLRRTFKMGDQTLTVLAQATGTDVAQLREYLLKGGFMWSDDFWGSRAWAVWEKQIGRVLPPQQYPIVDIVDPADPVPTTGRHLGTRIPLAADNRKRGLREHR